MMDLSAFESKFESYHGEVKAVADRLKKVETTSSEAKSGLERIELAIGRMPRGSGNSDTAKAASLEHKAFENFLRHGPERLDADEIKALHRSTDPNGGYLADVDFQAELLRDIVQFSPVRQAARVGATSSASVILPRRTGTMTAGWVTEIGNRPATEPSYGNVTIPIAELACYVDVSNQLLEDAVFNLSAELAFDFSEQFGAIESTAFVLGNGVGQPEGFMFSTDVTSVNSGSAAAITADGMIDLFYSTKPYYRGRGVWMLNSTSLASVRKLKDGMGNYIWQPGIAAGQPETILGRPVVEAPDMPNEGAGLYPVVFGDFQSGYRIYDRVSLAVLRDPYSIATTGQTRFHARRRTGGAVVKSEAIRKLKCST